MIHVVFEVSQACLEVVFAVNVCSEFSSGVLPDGGRHGGHLSLSLFLSLPAPNYAQLHLQHKWAAVDVSQGVRSSISCVCE